VIIQHQLTQSATKYGKRQRIRGVLQWYAIQMSLPLLLISELMSGWGLEERTSAPRGSGLYLTSPYLCVLSAHYKFDEDDADVAATEHVSLTARRSVNGTYLAGSVLHSVYVQTLTECLNHCARACPYCGSVNAALAGRTAGDQLDGWWKCELNVDVGASSSSMLTTEEGWEFYQVYVTRCR